MGEGGGGGEVKYTLTTNTHELVLFGKDQHSVSFYKRKFHTQLTVALHTLSL